MASQRIVPNVWCNRNAEEVGVLRERLRRRIRHGRRQIPGG